MIDSSILSGLACPGSPEERHGFSFSRSVALLLDLPDDELLSIARSGGDEIVHMAYGGHNETIGPTWVGIDKGFYRKYGLDVRLIQVRSAQISMGPFKYGKMIF
jgi:hypothetical protein